MMQASLYEVGQELIFSILTIQILRPCALLVEDMVPPGGGHLLVTWKIRRENKEDAISLHCFLSLLKLSPSISASY